MKMNSIRKERIFVKILSNSLWDLPSCSSLRYFWNFGSILGLCLLTQIMTGLFLAFHYSSYSRESFASVISIIRETWSGWLIRLVHINGASVFFIFTYLHLFRGLFYQRRRYKGVWSTGVSIIILLMGISFLGYVLPWGQISYWAVAVITNLLSVIPFVGDQIVNWVWGGFSVEAPTLNRFYALHFLAPFILTALVVTHLANLHSQGSRNPLGLKRNIDKIEFHPYFTIKDVLFIFLVFISAFSLSTFYPFLLGDAVNNIPANPIQTPAHIQPEWYFLPSYAILRALPRKRAGVLALLLSVTIYLILPAYNTKFSPKFSSWRIFTYWIFVTSLSFLLLMGAMPAETPFIRISQVGSILFFSSVLLLNL